MRICGIGGSQFVPVQSAAFLFFAYAAGQRRRKGKWYDGEGGGVIPKVAEKGQQYDVGRDGVIGRSVGHL